MTAWTTPEPTEEELQLAVIDAQCKVDVGFWDAIDIAEDEGAQTILTSMRPQVETLKRSTDRLTENVAKIAASLEG